MNAAILIRPEAETELAEAVHWYEERRAGLGDELLLSVEACLHHIRAYPKAYPVIYKRIRRALIRRFPFGIFYMVRGDTVIVIAFFHASRAPKHWRRRA